MFVSEKKLCCFKPSNLSIAYRKILCRFSVNHPDNIMDDYDSDESLGDVTDTVATSVLLGYASQEAVPHGDPFNQLGGSPVWLDDQQHCPPSLVTCKTCNSYMSLLLQLNGDLPTRDGATQFLGHERRLYIWACRRKACRRKIGSIRAIRSVRVSKVLEKQDKKREEEQTKRNIGSSLFGGQSGGSGNPFASSASSSNPFASTSGSSNPFASTSNPFAPAATTKPTTTETSVDDLPATFASKARITSPAPSPQPSQTPDSPLDPWPTTYPTLAYPTYHLDADTEYLSPTAADASSLSENHAAFLDNNPDTTMTSASGSSSAKEEAGLYESAHDKTFQHFADTLAQNPEQVLRYEFAGAPLLCNRSDAVGALFVPVPGVASASGRGVSTTGTSKTKGIPRCDACGGARVFEMQLTPQAIVELEREVEGHEDVGLEGMEWEAIIVGVCEKDCGISESEQGQGKVRYLEEWCGVQWEEVVARRG